MHRPERVGGSACARGFAEALRQEPRSGGLTHQSSTSATEGTPCNELRLFLNSFELIVDRYSQAITHVSVAVQFAFALSGPSPKRLNLLDRKALEAVI